MFKLRCAKKEEYDFLYNLLECTIKKYYVETFGSWDEKIERGYFDESFNNWKAQDFYKRIGFIKIGETETHLVMSRSPDL